MSKRNKKTYQEGQTISFQNAPSEVQELMKELVTLCPFRKIEFTELEKLDIQFTRVSNGWQFVCRACPGTECAGFILDTVQSAEKSRTRFLRL